MQVSQGSIGINWRKGDTFEVSLEGFYKDYDKIPLSVADGIPLTCKGNDYGVIGNELLTSTAQGRSYGAEPSPQMADCQEAESGLLLHAL